MHRDLLSITYTDIPIKDPEEAIETAIARVRDEFPDDSSTTLRIDTIKTAVDSPDTHSVTLNVRLSRLFAAHEDPREMVDIVLDDAEVEYGSRVLTFLSRHGYLGSNGYTDEFVSRHTEALRQRGYDV